MLLLPFATNDTAGPEQNQYCIEGQDSTILYRHMCQHGLWHGMTIYIYMHIYSLAIGIGNSVATT